MSNRDVTGWVGVLVACIGIGVSITIPDIRCALGLQQQGCKGIIPPSQQKYNKG